MPTVQMGGLHVECTGIILPQYDQRKRNIMNGVLGHLCAHVG